MAPAVRLLALLALLPFLAACEAPRTGAGLATIESAAFGLAMRELPRATLRSLGLSYGLAVVKVEAAAAHAGLRMGDVIYGVNHNRIKSAVDFARLVAEQPAGAPLALLVRRGGTDLYLPVETGINAGRAGRRRPTDTLLRT
jgi:S1-C subfamily serine protease